METKETRHFSVCRGPRSINKIEEITITYTNKHVGHAPCSSVEVTGKPPHFDKKVSIMTKRQKAPAMRNEIEIPWMQIAERVAYRAEPALDVYAQGRFRSQPFAPSTRTKISECISCEKRGSMATITANVWNVSEVYDEIDSLLDEIERDEDIRAVAIYTLNGLFASLPIR